MSYYQALGLTREPFSNSPDPDMLYRSRTHLECLQHMEIAVRLRRGLNVVLGEVGTGKTTLSRELIRVLAQEGDIEAYLLDDPYCPSTTEFLLSLARLFGLDTTAQGRDAALLKDALKAELLSRSQNGGRTVALVVDEGQKITPECLELLRELLNFETNAHKLLQIVIFAQTEFEEILHERPNLEDRVNFLYRLTPLDRVQTRRMIETRLLLCTPDGKIPAIFTRLALRRIHKLTGGYPRKIVRLCHLSMLLAVGFGKRRIGWGLVGRASRESLGVGRVWLRRLVVVGAAGSLAALLLHIAGPALPDARQAALDALGRMQTSLSAVVFDPAAPAAAPKVAAASAAAANVPAPAALPAAPEAPKTVAEVPACEEALGLTASTSAPTATPTVAKTAAPAKKPVETASAAPAVPVRDKAVEPAPQVAPAATPAVAASPSSHAAPQAEPTQAGTVTAEAQITKAAAAAATKAPVEAAPVVRAAAAALAQAPDAAAASAPAATVAAPVATAPAAPAVAPLAEPVALVRSHGLGRPEPAAPAAVPAVQSAAPVLATVPAAPAQAVPSPAVVAPRPAFAPAAPAQGLGAALTLAAAALPPEPADQIIVVSPEYADSLQATPAAVPVAPVAPAAAAVAAPALPAILGETTVPSGWAVTRQAARIYGHARRSVMTRIAKVNPGMDFNRVRAGDPIVFPTIPAEPLPQGACLIRVGMVESLQKAFAVIGQQREADPGLSLYCTVQTGGTLHFDLVLANVFQNRQEAEIALAGLPRHLAAAAVVVDGYPAGTVALTDVSLWPGQPGAQKIAAPARSGARQVAVSGPARQDMLP
ncbi:ExeA family protein [Desulfovibrio sp. TomC]|uniref:ExeA family protein n=1 Tax=Desulfovibrio sp. TomC TaxID=1562888 RepID=UPI00057315AD|nr:AAA family ATPase [Desulfovibrio sp. TomC]KHK02553.1 General secretion pathway protein A [Desulfovibrio sp. TomC]